MISTRSTEITFVFTRFNSNGLNLFLVRYKTRPVPGIHGTGIALDTARGWREVTVKTGRSGFFNPLLAPSCVFSYLVLFTKPVTTINRTVVAAVKGLSLGDYCPRTTVAGTFYQF